MWASRLIQSLMFLFVPLRNQLFMEILAHGADFFLCKFEQVRKRLASRESSIWISQLIKIWIKECFKRVWSCLGVISQKSWNKINCFFRSSGSEDFFPWEWFDLWESIFFIVRIHCCDLFSAGCTKDLNDFNKLVNSALAWENWLTK